MNDNSNRLGVIYHFISKNRTLSLILCISVVGALYFVLGYNPANPVKLDKSSKEAKFIIHGVSVKADSLFQKGNVTKAIQSLDEGLQLAKDYRLKSEETKLLFKKALLQEKSGDVQGEVFSYLSILKIERDQFKLADIRKRLSKIYSRDGYDKGVVDLYIPVLKNKKLSREFADANMFLAAAYINRKMPDSVLFYITRAEKTINQSDNKQVSSLMLFKANYYIGFGQFSKATVLLDSAKTLQRKIGDTLGLSLNYFARGLIAYHRDDFYTVAKEFEKSASFLEQMNEGVNLHSGNSRVKNIIAAYRNIAGAYGEVGNTKLATHFYRKASDFEDSIASVNKRQSIGDYVSNFEFQFKAEEIRKLNEKKRLLQNNLDAKQRQKYLLIAILILLIALSIYGFRLFVAKERQHKLNEDVLERDKQLLHKELEIVRKKVEYDSQLISEKEDLIAELEDKLTNSVFDEKEQEGLLQVIDGMKEGLRQERENIGMDILMNKDNARFYKKLKGKHPDITQTEARFCTLLYLNLDTKEIARILNISLDGVRKGRHRLRKKLNIGNGGDITNYLQGI